MTTLTLATMAFLAMAQPCGDFSANMEDIRITHLRGDLTQAIDKINTSLTCPDVTTEQKISYHLTLATIYDRQGLHDYNRPHPGHLRHIAIAASISEGASLQTQAEINMAYAEYNYSAGRFIAPEQTDEIYTKAYAYSQAALAGFEETGDLYGQSDAVHKMGLIHMQRRELVEARKFFELSLRLENETGAPRPRILADYDRHVGFVESIEGKPEKALPLFKSSFELRRDNGIDDAAIYAGQSYASTLVSLDRAEEALPPITYAIKVAERLNSSYGKMISYNVLGRAQEQLGNKEVAKQAYEKALETAQGIGHESGITGANEGLARVGG